MNRKSLFLLLVTPALFIYTGCQKKTHKPKTTENSVAIEINKSSETTYDKDHSKQLKAQKWHVTNKRIIVLFGYDFNEAETTNNYLYILNERFGLESEGGLISPLTFPGSFKHGTKSYVSDFKDIVKNNYKDVDIIGMILLGAPEKTHRVLESLQDENDLYFPVFALFPQDDNFGMEATCDLIIEKSQQVKEDQIPDTEEGVNQLVAFAPEVLINSIEYMKILDEMKISISDRENGHEALEGILLNNFPVDNKMMEHVARILKGHTFSNFIDQDTGISAYNHFIIN